MTKGNAGWPSKTGSPSSNKGNAGLPSKTGNPSGKGRDNNPPRTK